MFIARRCYTLDIVTTKTKRITKKTVSQHAKHLLVPHKGNQYHPHLIRGKGISIMVAAIIISQLGYNMLVHGNMSVLGRTTTTTVDGLLAQTNEARQAASLPPLTLNPKLDQAAYEKAHDMLQNNYWAHVSPTGVQPWSWITSVGYNYSAAGENLAKNYDSSKDTLDAWLASPSHRANILNTHYTEVGFAVVDGNLDGKDTSLVVAYYAQPAQPSVLGANTPSTSAANFSQPAVHSNNPLTYLGTIVQSLNPATVGSLALLTIAFGVALVTYHYRRMLPKKLRYTWKAHHAAYKAGGFAVLAIMIVSLGVISTGQI